MSPALLGSLDKASSPHLPNTEGASCPVTETAGERVSVHGRRAVSPRADPDQAYSIKGVLLLVTLRDHCHLWAQNYGDQAVEKTEAETPGPPRPHPCAASEGG